MRSRSSFFLLQCGHTPVRGELCGQQARAGVTWPDRREYRVLRAASLSRDGTARMETAAGRQGNGARWLAGDLERIGEAVGGHPRDGVDQRARIRMARVAEDLGCVGDLDDPA